MADYATEGQSVLSKTVLDGESHKPFTSRNMDYNTQDKQAIIEDPDEEQKSEKRVKEELKNEQSNDFATIAEKLPASATEIDPTPALNAEDQEFQTIMVNPEGGKIREEFSIMADESRNNNLTSIIKEDEKSKD